MRFRRDSITSEISALRIWWHGLRVHWWRWGDRVVITAYIPWSWLGWRRHFISTGCLLLPWGIDPFRVRLGEGKGSFWCAQALGGGGYLMRITRVDGGCDHLMEVSCGYLRHEVTAVGPQYTPVPSQANAAAASHGWPMANIFHVYAVCTIIYDGQVLFDPEQIWRPLDEAWCRGVKS